MRLCTGLLLIALAGCSGGRPAEDLPRPVASGEAASACQRSFNAGLRARASGEAAAAVAPLEAAVQEDALCAIRRRGLAAEWLGVALERSGRAPEATQVWAAAIRATPTPPPPGIGTVAARWAGATRGRVLEDPQVLRALLASDPPSMQVRDVRARFLSQIGDLVPDSVRREAFVQGDPRRGVASGGSDRILKWLDSEDPLPGTPYNERVSEHARRVEFAMAAYANPRDLRGYDARGDLHVRFGAPVQKQTVRFNDTGFVRELARSGLSVSRSDFPNNEVWVYGGNTEARTYVLLEREEGIYEVGTSQDLIPASLRTIVGQTVRDRQRALVALAAARTIYSQLATFESGYGRMWADLQRYVESGQRFQQPGAALRQFNQQMSSAESGLRQRRAESEPPSASSLLEELGTLDVLVLPARFLDEDGAAVTELWWAASGVAGRPHDLVATLVTDPRTDARAQADSVRVAWDGDAEARAIVPVRPVVARCDGACPLALQLDARGSGDPGVLLRTFVWEATPEPLATDRLEMSDVLPLDAATDLAIVDGVAVPGQPISLRFEAYGLDAARGPAQFVVEYELVLRRFGNLLRRTRETAREGELTSFTQGSRTEQFLLLQTEDWAEANEVDVTLRVRDLKTNEEVERRVAFDVLR